MIVCVCVLGVVWFGLMFVNVYVDGIKEVVGILLVDYLWMLVLVLFFVFMLFYL